MSIVNRLHTVGTQKINAYASGLHTASAQRTNGCMSWLHTVGAHRMKYYELGAHSRCLVGLTRVKQWILTRVRLLRSPLSPTQALGGLLSVWPAHSHCFPRLGPVSPECPA